MQRFILVRTFHSLIALWVISIIVFALIRASGSPADALLDSEWMSAEQMEAMEEYWGVNDPLLDQYFSYLGKIVTGDFGESFTHQGYTVRELIANRFPNTLQLAGVAMLLSVVMAVPIGVLSALKKDTPTDFAGKIVALLGQSLPSFWTGIVLIWIFAVKLGWVPTSGKGGIDHMILPGITLGWFSVAALMRLIRSSMLENLDSEYVKLARIKGIREWKVVWKHCLRNAAIAPLTYFGVFSAAILTGSIITETVFAWPGMGALILQGVRDRDYAVVQTVTLFFAFMFIGANLLVDILYAYLDPRIRYR